MTELTGGQAVVRALMEQGVDTVFGLPGVQLDWLFDALYEERRRIRVIHTRHEQATSYMADGYARASGRPGVCVVVPGPGVLNAMAGLATAYACSSKVLCIAGQIPSAAIGHGRGFLHEIPDQLAALRGVVGWAERAADPQQAVSLVADVFQRFNAGRNRPAAIEVPRDVLELRAEVSVPTRVGDCRESVDDLLVDRAAALLAGAKRPLLFAGGGVLRAGAAPLLTRLAERLEAPVITSDNGRGAISSRHRLALPLLAAPQLVANADVIVVVGSRFLGPAGASWRPQGDQKVVQIDVNPQEVGRNQQVDIGITADASIALGQLVEVVRQAQPNTTWLAAAQRAREEVETLHAAIQPQAGLSAAIRSALPDDGILINGMTQVAYWNAGGFPVYEPNTFLTSGYQGTLGFELGTALGAKMGQPDRAVLAIAGDGGFMYQVQELATAVQHSIPVVVVVFNNNSYGNVKRIQKVDFGGRIIASDLHNPDLVALARAFGAEGMRAQGPEELALALRRAFQADGPVLIDCPIGEVPETPYIPVVMAERWRVHRA